MTSEGRVLSGCGHPNHGNADHDCRPFLPCDNPLCACHPMSDQPGRVQSEVECIADALFAYNTAEARHFVIHDGGYEGIAQVAFDAMKGRTPSPDEVREAVEKALAEVAGACNCHECAENVLDALTEAGYEVVARKDQTDV